MSTSTSSRAQSFVVPLLMTLFASLFGAVIIYVAGTTGMIIVALSMPFAVWFLWAARNVETLEERFPARKRSSPTPPAAARSDAKRAAVSDHAHA